MNNRLIVATFLYVTAVVIPTALLAQETPDHQAIRALLNEDQEAFMRADGERVLSLRDENYFVAGVPTNNGRPDFHGVTMEYTREDMKERILDPEWKGSPGAEVMADTTLDFKKSNEMVRIDVNGNYAVAISRIERAWNDTTKNARIRSGWESLWFLRKTDGKWKFTSAVGGISKWKEE